MSTKDTNVNTSESMGQYGNFPFSIAKDFGKQHIAVITVKTGDCTVSGKQHINNPEGLDIYPDWVSVVLPVGTWIVNLKNVVATPTGNSIAYYGG
jgi:hypothetical protein